MLECIIHNAKHCKDYNSMDPCIILISWEIASLFFLEDKQNVKFGGVVRCELYLHFECVFHAFI